MSHGDEAKGGARVAEGDPGNDELHMGWRHHDVRVGSGGLPCMAWCDRVVLAIAWCSPSPENTTMSRMRAVTNINNVKCGVGSGEQCGAITSPSRLRHVGHLPLTGVAEASAAPWSASTRH